MPVYLQPRRQQTRTIRHFLLPWSIALSRDHVHDQNNMDIMNYILTDSLPVINSPMEEMQSVAFPTQWH